MENLVIIAASVSVIGFVITRLPLYIYLKYQRKNDNDDITIDVYLWRKILFYHMNIPIIELTERKDNIWLESELETLQGDSETHAQREKRYFGRFLRVYLKNPRRLRKFIRQLRKFTRNYCDIIYNFSRSLSCTYFSWRTSVGTDDAALTGMTVGLAWIVKRAMLHGMTKRFTFTNKPNIGIYPIFNNTRFFEVDLECIFSIRLGQIITAGISTFYILKKGGTGNG